MEIKPIHSKADCKAALKAISALVASDPVAAIKFRMEQQGLGPKVLEPMIGRRNRALTLSMVWRLHVGLGIPAASLIRPPVARV